MRYDLKSLTLFLLPSGLALDLKGALKDTSKSVVVYPPELTKSSKEMKESAWNKRYRKATKLGFKGDMDDFKLSQASKGLL